MNGKIYSLWNISERYITIYLLDSNIFEMYLKHESAAQLKKTIRDIVGKYVDLKDYTLFVFGSRISNKDKDFSDIDIGIEGKDEVPADIFLKIQEELENIPVLYTIEFVDFNKVSSDFYQVAKSNIEEI